MKPNSLLLTVFFIFSLFAFGSAQEPRPDDPLSVAPDVPGDTFVEQPPGAEPAPQPKPPGEEALKTGYKGPISVTIRYLTGFTAKISGATFGWVDYIYVDNKRGELYLIDDRNKRIVITDINGIYLYHFDYAHAKLRSPKGMVLDPAGDIYVYEGNRIIVLDYRGVFKREFDLSQLPDKDKGINIQSIAIFNPPSSLPLPSAAQGDGGLRGEEGGGLIYIGDSKKGKIIVLSGKDGSFIKDYGRGVIMGGNFYNIYVDETGFMFLDPPANTVYRHNHEGKLIKKWGRLTGLLGGVSMPVGIAIDEKSKRVVLIDANRMMVVVFDMLGNALFEFGGPRVFSWPRTVATDNEGHIYVADNTGVIRVFEAVETLDDDEPPPRMPAEDASEDKDEDKTEEDAP